MGHKLHKEGFTDTECQALEARKGGQGSEDGRPLLRQLTARRPAQGPVFQPPQLLLPHGVRWCHVASHLPVEQVEGRVRPGPARRTPLSAIWVAIFSITSGKLTGTIPRPLLRSTAGTLPPSSMEFSILTPRHNGQASPSLPP